MDFREIRRGIRIRYEILKGKLIEIYVKKKPIVYGLNCSEKRNVRIIVSMASYNLRYETIELTLKSLLLQSVKPDKIIVYLDDDLPENKPSQKMIEYIKYGIEYRHTTDGLGSHKKYYYAMQEYPDDIIITVDDDIIYPPSMISSLMKCYRKWPNCICARRVHKITKTNNGINPYKEWQIEYRHKSSPSHFLFATGGAGCLYFPRAFSADAFDKAAIIQYCLGADDIWLKIIELLNDIEVVWAVNGCVMPRLSDNSQNVALYHENLDGGKNDQYIVKLQEVFPDAFKKIT